MFAFDCGTGTLTTGADTVFGTAKSDTINATAGLAADTTKTLNNNDVIVDSSAIDNDTINITATEDVTSTATIVGIENINFNLDAVATTAGTTWGIKADNISAGTLTAKVIKEATTVNAVSVTALKSGMKVSTDLATATIDGVANADLTLNMTKATGDVTVADVTGTIDDLTINSSTTGLTTIADANAEENIVINSQGSVTITNITPTTTTANTLTVNAEKAITVANYTTGGDVSLTANTGDVTVSMAAHTNNSTDDLNVTAKAGNITITNGGAGTGKMTLSAAGNVADAITTNDGDITVAANNTALAADITATGDVTITSMTAVKDLTVNFGQASTISNTTAAVTKLTLSSTNAAAAAADQVITATAGGTALNAVDNIIFTGSNNVTLAMDTSDFAAAQASTAGGTTAAAVIATDNSTAVTTIQFETDAAAVDVSKLAVDRIAFNFDNGANAITVASGQNIYNKADQTSLTLTAAAVAGNSVNLFVEDDSSVTDTTADDLGNLTSTNIATVNLHITEIEAAVTAGAVNVGVANTLKVSGPGALTVNTSIIAKEFDASASTGVMDLKMLNTAAATIVKTGSANDMFRLTNNTAADYKIDGGAGVDTIVFAAGAMDLSGATLALTSIEKLDITLADAIVTMSGAQTTGKGYVVVGSANDTLAVVATNATGESIDLSGFAVSGAVMTITGLAGGDTLTGSSTTANTFVGGAGSDTIIGGNAVDTITVLNEVAASDTITLGGGADIINVDTAVAATIKAHIIKDFNFGTATTTVDKVNLSDTAYTGLTTTTNMSDTGAGAMAAGAAVVAKLGTDGATMTGVDIVVIDTATYASDALMLAGLKTAGASTITYSAAAAENDSFFIIYSDGVNAHLAVATASAANLTTSEGIDSVATVMTFEGVSFAGLANIDSGDFAIIA